VTLEENLMKYHSFIRLSIALIVLIALMFGKSVQSIGAAPGSCGTWTKGGPMNWSGYMPQSSMHDFGTLYFVRGDTISVFVTQASRTTYPHTDILLNEDAHNIHVGRYVPASFTVVIPTSGDYDFHLFNGFAHSDGPVNAVVTCVGA
jgi:hypothetical protein